METDTDERNEKAKREYSAVLTVTSPAPEKKEYLDFSDQVRFNQFQEFPALPRNARVAVASEKIPGTAA